MMHDFVFVAVEDLQKVRLALVELRRREAAAIASESGALPTYAAGASTAHAATP
jgi:hypothetical protein